MSRLPHKIIKDLQRLWIELVDRDTYILSSLQVQSNLLEEIKQAQNNDEEIKEIKENMYFMLMNKGFIDSMEDFMFHKGTTKVIF